MNSDQFETGIPAPQGLYDFEQERDACGVGLVADLKNEPSHKIIEMGITVLKRLMHRGAVGSDPDTGDGAGILLALPDEFFRLVLPNKLPARGKYGVAMMFGGCGHEEELEAAVTENGGSVRAINAKGCGSFPRKKIDSLVEFVKTYKAKGLAWIVVNADGTIKSQIAKFFTPEKLQEIVDAMDGQPGDLILICADKDKVVFDSLGALRVELSKMLELTKPDDFAFLWITEFPMLEWDEEENRYVAVHHPFTAPMDEDLELIDTNPGAVRAKAYDIVLNGYELGGGSIRIHRRDIQKKMFELLGFSDEDAQERFGFLLDAFKYGVPPHGGLAFGLDRIIMLMSNAPSIRDVIAFPKVKDASCPMTDAPGVVDEKQLDELGIAIKETEEATEE